MMKSNSDDDKNAKHEKKDKREMSVSQMFPEVLLRSRMHKEGQQVL